MFSAGRDFEWRRRIEELLMRVNSGEEGGSLVDPDATLLLVDGNNCCLGVLAEEGASYSTSVGRPNAVINADETLGEAYKFGSGSF